jgi:hypothetical protein
MDNNANFILLLLIGVFVLYPLVQYFFDLTIKSNLEDQIKKPLLLFLHLVYAVCVYFFGNFMLYYLFYHYTGPWYLNIENLTVISFLSFSISSWWIKIPILLFSYISTSPLYFPGYILPGTLGYSNENEYKEGALLNSFTKSFHFAFGSIAALFLFYFIFTEDYGKDWFFNNRTFSVDIYNDNFLEYMIYHPLLWVLLSSSIVLSLIYYFLIRKSN